VANNAVYSLTNYGDVWTQQWLIL